MSLLNSFELSKYEFSEIITAPKSKTDNKIKSTKFDFKFAKNVSFAVLKSRQMYKSSPRPSRIEDKLFSAFALKKNAKKHHATSKAKIALSSFDKNFCIYAPYALSTPPQMV